MSDIQSYPELPLIRNLSKINLGKAAGMWEYGCTPHVHYAQSSLYLGGFTTPPPPSVTILLVRHTLVCWLV